MTCARNVAGKAHDAVQPKPLAGLDVLCQSECIGGGLHAGTMMSHVQIHQNADGASGGSGGSGKLIGGNGRIDSDANCFNPGKFRQFIAGRRDSRIGHQNIVSCFRHDFASPGLATVRPADTQFKLHSTKERGFVGLCVRTEFEPRQTRIRRHLRKIAADNLRASTNIHGVGNSSIDMVTMV